MTISIYKAMCGKKRKTGCQTDIIDLNIKKQSSLILIHT